MDTIQITQAIRELRQMSVGELREKYIEVFGEANRSRNKDYLIRRIAWRIQANAEGGITERARLRAQELHKPKGIRGDPKHPPSLASQATEDRRREHGCPSRGAWASQIRNRFRFKKPTVMGSCWRSRQSR
jgi:hypothetical protein